MEILDAVMRVYIHPESIICSATWKGYIKLVNSHHQTANYRDNYTQTELKVIGVFLLRDTSVKISV